MKTQTYIVKVSIPDKDGYFNGVEDIREKLQHSFDFESDDEGRWKVDVIEVNEQVAKDREKVSIERWELEDAIKTFEWLTDLMPIIKKRQSCLHRQIMKTYAKLVYLFNGEKFGSKEFVEYYMGQKDVPPLKTLD